MDDPHLFGPFFRGPSWDQWRVFLAALFGLPLTAAQVDTYREYTQRTAYRAHRGREAWMVVGRRGGKSRIAALVAVYLAAFRDYRHMLVPGELGLVPVIAADRDQGRNLFGYILGFLTSIPLLADIVKGKPKATSVELKTGVTIEVRTASFRSIRGYTVVGALLDEIAFWRNEESSNPDHEIVNAIRPGMLTVPGALLIGLSSPYARKGVLWERYDQHFGKDESPVLVWQAGTLAMNPTVPREELAAALAEDEAKAGAEWLAEFRRDVESYVSREIVQAATVVGRHELAPEPGRRYVAFADPSGGSADSFTLAIAHEEGGKGVVDCIRERKPPFSPEQVVAEFAGLLKAYSCTVVRGDHYAGEWPREQFSKQGVSYVIADQHKSELYLAFLPALNSGRVELLDEPRLFTQLCGLERRTARGGRDTVDHGPGGHDDVINAAAGALVQIVGGVSDGLGFFRYLQERAQAATEAQGVRGRAVSDPEPPGSRNAVPPAPTADAALEARRARYEELERQARGRRG